MSAKAFYPRLAGPKESHGKTLEALEEHKLVKKMPAELEAASKDSEEWLAKANVLKENVEHHVRGEEGEAYKGNLTAT